MAIELQFDSESVAKQLSDSIMSSSFKTLFQKAVDNEIKKISESSWNTQSILSEVVNKHIREMVSEVLRKDFDDKIKQIILQKFTEEQLENLVEKFMSKIEIGRY